MTTFAELAKRLLEIADEIDNDFANLSEEQLITAGGALLVAAQATLAFLTDRLNGSDERARVEIARAWELPPTVLRRRASEAERIVNDGGLPNVPQHAAYATLMIREHQRICERVQFLRSGGRLN